MLIKMIQRERVDFSVSKAHLPSGVESYTNVFYVDDIVDISASIGNQLVADGYAVATTDPATRDILDKAELIPANASLFLGAA